MNNIQETITKINNYYGVDVSEKTRIEPNLSARRMAAFILRERLNLRFVKISPKLGLKSATAGWVLFQSANKIENIGNIANEILN